MKKLLTFIVLILLFSCKKEEQKYVLIPSSETELNSWQDNSKITHNLDKDTVWKKPVRYYIEDKNCSPLAKDFYYGIYNPTDEPKTEALLNLILTDNDKLRPFYRWILNKTILTQDGALAEYTGLPARKYAEKYPEEFFEYMDFDKSGEKTLYWADAIGYSGFNQNESASNLEEVRKDMVKTMNSNCKNCNDSLKNKIQEFSKICFIEFKID